MLYQRGAFSFIAFDRPSASRLGRQSTFVPHCVTGAWRCLQAQAEHWNKIAQRLQLQPVQRVELVEIRNAALKDLHPLFALRQEFRSQLQVICCQRRANCLLRGDHPAFRRTPA